MTETSVRTEEPPEADGPPSVNDLPPTDQEQPGHITRWYRRVKEINGRILVGSIMLVSVLLLAIFAPLIATHDPVAIDSVNRLQGPSLDNWFGTDNHGRDVYSRVVYGSRVSVFVGTMVVIMTTICGTVLGLVSGFYRRVDGVIMRVMDAFQSFPSILLAIAIMAALGASARNVVIALTVSYTPRTARIVRGRVLSIREEPYIEAARAIGLGDVRILRRYVFPNTLAPMVVQATFIFALAIIAEAGLSFVGAGVPPPEPSWGNILADGRAYMRQAQWMTLFPGMFIMFSVLGLNILGDGLRDVLDPRLKDRR
jgi:peptide/nickel transport system permease protein